jgi:hypothetical protein
MQQPQMLNDRLTVSIGRAGTLLEELRDPLGKTEASPLHGQARYIILN